MIVISRTPVRISFFGGGTDYPEYYQRKKGAVLGTSINQYTHVSINELSPYFEHKIRIGYSKTELVKSVDEICHPSIRECLRFLGTDDLFLDIHIFSDLPAKTGLGSSSSFTVGFLNAYNAMQGKKLSKNELATNACIIEQEWIKENVGSQDQFHAAYGGLNIIEFSSSGIDIRPVITTKGKKKLFEESLMVFYTGLTRFASDILKEQMIKTQKKDNDSFLSEMYDLVFEAERIFSNSSEDKLIEDLGTILDYGWNLKKKLSSQISNSSIDDAYSIAKKAGACGGKLCGAGSGGFLALLVPKEKQKKVAEALKNLLIVPVQFENEGSKIIYMR